MNIFDKNRIIDKALEIQRNAYRDAEMGRKSWACAIGECYAAAIIAKWALFEITDEELKAVPKDEGSNDGRLNQ